MPTNRPRTEMTTDAWVELTVCGGLLEAQLLQTRLEYGGIEVLLKYETAARLFGLTLDGLGKIRVMVPQSQWDDALEILSAPPVEAGDDEPPASSPPAVPAG